MGAPCSRLDVGKQRPVLILTTISKLFEHLVNYQVEEFLDKPNLLY